MKRRVPLGVAILASVVAGVLLSTASNWIYDLLRKRGFFPGQPTWTSVLIIASFAFPLLFLVVLPGLLKLRDSGLAGDSERFPIDRLPPLVTPGPAIPLQRPPRADHFTGRERELAKLPADLQPGRVVTLCGPGGMGKTALAAEAAWMLAPGEEPPERFPDGIVCHSFYNQPQAALALEAIARAYGEQPHPTPRDAARRALAGKRALLILDGTELADDLRAVLEVRGGCGVLVTSRKRGDAVAGWQDLEPLPGQDAVALLQAWGKGQATDEATDRCICEQVGRLPLAVRLAGRYLNQTGESAAEYLTWLQETPIQALSHGQHREESVDLLLARSLEQVSQGAGGALAVVGLLALAPFGVEPIAQALASASQVVKRWLGELVSYGLLLRRGDRYEVSHALVHTYARRRMAVPDEACRRLAAYYDALVREQRQEGLEGYRRLDAERGHLMWVLDGCVEREDWEAARSLVWAVEDYLDMQGHWTERVTALNMGVAAAQQLGHRRDEGAFLGSLGLAYSDLGQAGRAIEHHEKALAIAREIGDRRGEGVDLGNLGLAYSALGQVERAIEYYEQALTVAREIGDRRGEGVRLGDLGNAYRALGQVERAIEHYGQALAIARETGDKRGECNALGNLGNAYYSLGRAERATEHYGQALAIAREIGDRRGEGNALGNLGNACSAMGQAERAIEHYGQALAVARQIGDRRMEGSVLGNLGNAYRALGQAERAIEHYGQALAIAREIGDRHGEGNALGNLGNACSALGQAERASEHYGQALAIAREIGDRLMEGSVLGNLGNAYRALGQAERAREYLWQSLAILEEVKSPAADRVRRWLERLE